MANLGHAIASTARTRTAGKFKSKSFSMRLGRDVEAIYNYFVYSNIEENSDSDTER